MTICQSLFVLYLVLLPVGAITSVFSMRSGSRPLCWVSLGSSVLSIILLTVAWLTLFGGGFHAVPVVAEDTALAAIIRGLLAASGIASIFSIAIGEFSLVQVPRMRNGNGQG